MIRLLFAFILILSSTSNAHADSAVPSELNHQGLQENKPTDDKNNHSTLNVVILGDSNTFIGGDNCDQPKGWNTWFKERFAPATCKSYARSGATWTNTTSTSINTTEKIDIIGNNNVIFNQIIRLKEAYTKHIQPKPHLILIAAGTNDAWFTQYRPNVFDKTVEQVFANNKLITNKPVNQVTTLAESVRFGCELLMEAFPDAQIILLTPMQSTAAGNEKIFKVGDIIEKCSHYMSLGVIRQDSGSCVYSIREQQKKHFTSDGTHTSEAGARKNGYWIANQVSAMLQW